MRPQSSAAPCGGQAGQNVLLEGVVGPTLGWCAEEVASPFVAAPGLAIPLLDGVRRVSQYHVELTQAVALDVLGLGQGIAPNDFKVFHAVQKQIHAGDAGGDEVALLPVELERAVFAA